MRHLQLLLEIKLYRMRFEKYRLMGYIVEALGMSLDERITRKVNDGH